MYDATSAGTIAHAITRRAGPLPTSRTVKSVARKMNGKLNAPQVL